MEALRRYLNAKELEMRQARLNGNMKLFNMLNSFNAKLDREVNQNPELLPIVAKVIIENDASPRNTVNSGRITFTSSKKNSLASSSGSSVEYFQILKPPKSGASPRFTTKLVKPRSGGSVSPSSSSASSSATLSSSSSRKFNLEQSSLLFNSAGKYENKRTRYPS